jgi:hypothetical protein
MIQGASDLQRGVLCGAAIRVDVLVSLTTTR